MLTQTKHTTVEDLHAGLNQLSGQTGWNIGFSIGTLHVKNTQNNAPKSLKLAVLTADQLLYNIKRHNKNALKLTTCQDQRYFDEP